MIIFNSYFDITRGYGFKQPKMWFHRTSNPKRNDSLCGPLWLMLKRDGILFNPQNFRMTYVMFTSI